MWVQILAPTFLRNVTLKKKYKLHRILRGSGDINISKVGNYIQLSISLAKLFFLRMEISRPRQEDTFQVLSSTSSRPTPHILSLPQSTAGRHTKKWGKTTLAAKFALLQVQRNRKEGGRGKPTHRETCWQRREPERPQSRLGLRVEGKGCYLNKVPAKRQPAVAPLRSQLALSRVAVAGDT